MKSDDSGRQFRIRQYRRAVIGHLMRQSGGPSADPRDALRIATTYYGLIIRQACIGRFTSRICLIDGGKWVLDFNPLASKHDLVMAIWHELAELLCLSDDIVQFDSLSYDQYQESAVSAYDRRHLCAIGVERYVRMKLRDFPEVREQLLADKIRNILIVRSSTASTEPLLPQITRERWFDDEFEPDTSSLSA
jgi:hypothetical protein